MPDEKQPAENKIESSEITVGKSESKNLFGKWIGPRSPIGGLLPGLILILLGVLFLLDYLKMLPGDQWWQYFLVGLGIIFIVEAWMQYLNPATRRPGFSRIISGLVLVGVGLFFLFGFSQWWSLVLIVIGLLLVLNFVFRGRKAQ
jgi:hypothetical protein